MKIFRTERFAEPLAWMMLVGFATSPVLAQLLGPEFQVNSYTTSAQSEPAVAADGSGNLVVVWDGTGLNDVYGVFGQRFDSTGSRVGSEFQVHTYTSGAQLNPVVAADGAGNFVVVWGSQYQDGSSLGVFGQRFNSAGSPVGSEFQVNSYTTGMQIGPSVAASGSGDFVVVWSTDYQDGSSSGVFGQRFDSAGSPVGSEFQVNSYTTSWQSVPAVAADGSGNFVVVWNGVGLNDDVGVFGQRFDSAGSPVGSEFQVNSSTTGDQTGPALAADGSGNFVVVWTSYYQDGSGGGVFGQRYDSAGNPLGSEFQVNSSTAIGQSPRVAADGSGDFVVVWQSDINYGTSIDVFAQRFNSSGSPVAFEFRANSYLGFSQFIPAVAADLSGNFVVVWSSDFQDGSSKGVFGQRLTPPFFFDGFESGDACVWSAAVGGGC